MSPGLTIPSRIIRALVYINCTWICLYSRITCAALSLFACATCSTSRAASSERTHAPAAK